MNIYFLIIFVYADQMIQPLPDISCQTPDLGQWKDSPHICTMIQLQTSGDTTIPAKLLLPPQILILIFYSIKIAFYKVYF